MIKVEPPNVGDPLRVWRELDIDGVSPWWRSIARNKKSVTIDMRKEEGRRYAAPPAVLSASILNSRPQARQAARSQERRHFRELQTGK